MRGDSGVAGEGRVVGVPKFHSWGKCRYYARNARVAPPLRVKPQTSEL